jgi:CRISPR-associated protein Csm3
MRLLTYKIITGEIECITGLHIGSSADIMEIGGMDNPIIKHPITGFPYVPGSAQRGPPRSLLEIKYGLFDKTPGQFYGTVHKWCGDRNCFMCRMYGTSAPMTNLGPTRLLYRDANLTADSAEILKKLKREKGLPYSEEKYENSINRVDGTAVPRSIERVPSGMKFDMEIVYGIYDVDNDSGKVDIDNIKYIKEGLKLVEIIGLGGSKVRGSGKVKFNNLKIFDTTDLTLEDFIL